MNKVAQATLVTGLCAALGAAQRPPEMPPIPHPLLTGTDSQLQATVLAERAGLEALLEAEAASATDLSDAFGGIGRVYFAYQYVDAARAAFTNASTLAPADIRWPYYLGLLALEQRDLPRAAAHFTSVLDQRPGDSPALLRLAEVHIESGDAVAADAALRQVLRNRDEAAAHYGLGRLALEAGQHREAARRFETTLELQPEATRVHYLLSRAYRGLGDEINAQRHAALYGPAEVVFEEPLLAELSQVATSAEFHVVTASRAAAAGRTDFAKGEYRRALELDPESTNAMTGLGSLLEQEGDDAAALAHYSHGLALDPGNVFFSIALGRIQARRGATTLARDHFERALAVDPANEEAGLRLAALIGDTDPERALTLFDHVLAHHPLSRQALLERPRVLESAGKLDEAIRELKALAKLMPEDPEVLLALGTALMDGDSPATAAARLEEVTQSSAGPRLRALAHYNRGLLAARASDRTAAMDHFQAAADLDPDLVDAHFQLGNSAALEQRYEAAVVHFTSVLELEPAHSRARLAQATSLALGGEWAAARDTMVAGIEVTPDSTLRLSLARLLLEAPEVQVRDPATALRLAQALFVEAPSIEHAETVALAFAETGRPAEALRWQTRILQEVQQTDDDALLSRVQHTLESYRSRLDEGNDAP